jgi:hypothetical protein
MLEYVFFNTKPRDAFIRYLDDNGISHEATDDDMGLIVAVPEDLDELILQNIENHYDELMENAEELLLEEGSEEEKSLAAITIELDNGQTTYVTVSPDFMNRILGVVSMDELNEFIDSIASSIQHPDDRPLCKR